MGKKFPILFLTLLMAAAVGFEIGGERVAAFAAKLPPCSWLFPSAVFFLLIAAPLYFSFLLLKKVDNSDHRLVPSVGFILFAEAVAVFAIVSALRARVCVETVIGGEVERFSTIGSWDFVSAWSAFVAWFAAGFSAFQALLPFRYLTAVARRLSRIVSPILEKEYLWLIFLFATAFILRLVWVLYSGTLPVSDCKAFNDLALGMARGEGYVKPGGIPTAYWLPGYPLFLAGIYKIFGAHLIAAKIGNALLGAGLAVLTYFLGKEAFSQNKARLGALIIALLPAQILYSALLASELLFTFCSVAAVLIVVLSLKKKRQYPSICAAGALIGFATLVRSHALFLLPLLYLYVLLIAGAKRQTLVKLSLLTVCAFLTVLPWMLRNARVFGRPALLSTNSGINFWIGNNEMTDGSQMGYSLEVLSRMNEQGELAANNAGWQAGIQFIRENPKRLLVLAAYKLYYLYAKETTAAVDWNYVDAARNRTEDERCVVAYLAQGAYLLLCLLAAFGIFMVNKKNLLQKLFILMIIGWTGIHIIFFGLDRFHFPLEVIFALFAASAVLSLSYKVPNDKPRVSTRG